MAITLIDINDVGIRIYRSDGTIIASPGVSHISTEGVLFGEAARAKARSQPQGLFDKYWSQLDDVPLTSRHRGVRHHADLAYKHLQSLIEEHGPFDQVLFLVPSDYTRAKLAMLLGIAKALELTVVGLIDTAVAHVTGLKFTTPHVQFLDLSLHRTCVSELSVGAVTRFEKMQTLERSGKNYLSDITIKWIADCFLDQARFDPLHDAASEQLLFDRLDEWLVRLKQAAHINIGLQHHSRLHEISLARSGLIAALDPAFQALAASLKDNAQVVLSHRFEIYPHEVLAKLNPIVVDSGAALNTFLQQFSDTFATRTSDDITLNRSFSTLNQAAQGVANGA